LQVHKKSVSEREWVVMTITDPLRPGRKKEVLEALPLA